MYHADFEYTHADAFEAYHRFRTDRNANTSYSAMFNLSNLLVEVYRLRDTPEHAECERRYLALQEKIMHEEMIRLGILPEPTSWVAADAEQYTFVADPDEEELIDLDEYGEVVYMDLDQALEEVGNAPLADLRPAAHLDDLTTLEASWAARAEADAALRFGFSLS